MEKNEIRKSGLNIEFRRSVYSCGFVVLTLFEKNKANVKIDKMMLVQ